MLFNLEVDRTTTCRDSPGVLVTSTWAFYLYTPLWEGGRGGGENEMGYIVCRYITSNEIL